jgi:hypothetical protein
MRQRKIATIFVFGVLALIAISASSWVESSTAVAVCSVPEDKPGSGIFKDAVAVLDKIIDLGLTLSTTLAGLGSALIMGWKTGIKLTYTSRLILLSATLFFVQSALYAITWRYWISELLRIQCYEWLQDDHLQRLFAMHLSFFFLGLASIGVLVISSFFAEQPRHVEDQLS